MLGREGRNEQPNPKEDGRKGERSPYGTVDEAPGVGRGKNFGAYSRRVQRAVRLSWHCPAGGRRRWCEREPSFDPLMGAA